MRFLYGVSDTIYPKSNNTDNFKVSPEKSDPTQYKFVLHPMLNGLPMYDKNDVSILFKTTPDTLLNLASHVVDAIPLPSVFTWTNWDVCRFIRNLGYPHYQRTFRENYINGRTLLLLDASALSAMNIKNFHDIRCIAYCIRCLFHFEMVKFSRSISLAPQYHYELYKLFRVKTGPRYELARRTDLWRMMQLIRKRTVNLSHFDLLERWLAFERDPDDYPELIGGAPRTKLYRQCLPFKKHVHVPETVVCTCSLCDCSWQGKRAQRLPWTLSCLKRPDPPIVLDCPRCLPPPCTCQWSSKMFCAFAAHQSLVLSFPAIYAHGSRARKSVASIDSARISVKKT